MKRIQVVILILLLNGCGDTTNQNKRDSEVEEKDYLEEYLEREEARDDKYLAIIANQHF